METKYKILIIDDDKFLLNMYALKFKKAGLDVNTAASADEALQKVTEGFMPDIFIIDIIMPGMDGIELLEKMRKEHIADGATIVILTNQGETTDIERAKELKSDGYIVKATAIPSEVVDEVMGIHSKKRGVAKSA